MNEERIAIGTKDSTTIYNTSHFSRPLIYAKFSGYPRGPCNLLSEVDLYFNHYFFYLKWLTIDLIFGRVEIGPLGT